MAANIWGGSVSNDWNDEGNWNSGMSRRLWCKLPKTRKVEARKPLIIQYLIVGFSLEIGNFAPQPFLFPFPR